MRLCPWLHAEVGARPVTGAPHDPPTYPPGRPGRRACQVWKKAWSEEEGRWYFLNDDTKETQWEPPAVLGGDVGGLLTPRTFARRKKRGELDLDRLYRPARPPPGEAAAATLLQA